MNKCCPIPNVKILDDYFTVKLLLLETKKITVGSSINLKLKVCLNCKQYLNLEMTHCSRSGLHIINLTNVLIKL